LNPQIYCGPGAAALSATNFSRSRPVPDFAASEKPTSNIDDADIALPTPAVAPFVCEIRDFACILTRMGRRVAKRPGPFSRDIHQHTDAVHGIFPVFIINDLAVLGVR